MEAQNNQEKPWYRRWWGVLSIIFLFISLVLISAFVFLVLAIIKNPKNVFPEISAETVAPEQLKKINGPMSYFLGPKDNAPVTIVEFADYNCPHCRDSAPTIRKLSFKYKDQVKIIFRDYLTTEYSLNLALAARCAGEQGFYWLMHDKLFDSQGKDDVADLKTLAANLGVDTVKFNACFDKQKYNTQIAKDYSDGQALGVTGTPTFFINGHMVEGDIPENVWETIIQKLLVK